MFGRENLSIRWVANGYECGNLDRNQAGEVMNRMERRIKRQSNVIKKLHEKLDGNWEFWRRENFKMEQKFTKISAEKDKRIKELEDKIKELENDE